ncbi:GspH/FimT family protein [Lysobacter changpingensis]|jgi:type IV fimbrial biogenesis protein FimT|uniref:GspH/FimT family protein n=1 Tax=Lysobacter changpingensis TaxID=2792784 RepID=UPI001A8E39D0|nr:GspH/FimT family pseudopilin [Lysobacter changpingensis]
MAARANGLTLLELLVVVAVTAVLLTLGVPAFMGALERVRVHGAFSALTTSLAHARLSAVSRRITVGVCPSRDGRQCRKDLIWDQGWITFIDRARNGVPAGTDAILQHATPDLSGISVRSTVGRHLVRYQPSGFSAGSNVTLRICRLGDHRELGRVVVNNGGRARSERPTRLQECAPEP